MRRRSDQRSRTKRQTAGPVGDDRVFHIRKGTSAQLRQECRNGNSQRCHGGRSIRRSDGRTVLLSRFVDSIDRAIRNGRAGGEYNCPDGGGGSNGPAPALVRKKLQRALLRPDAEETCQCKQRGLN